MESINGILPLPFPFFLDMKKFFAVMGVFLITFSLAFVAMTILASKSAALFGEEGEGEGGVRGGEWGGWGGWGGWGEEGWGEAERDWIKPYPEGTMFLAWWTFLGDYGESFPYLQGLMVLLRIFPPPPPF